ncbi:hypothetical protein EIN_246970 [Entamoeba invadens IP1]|uniref:Uncharacterized protein n=1 Tax=Entamoeba invadens IP1 TaxID=370355 RepID=A0A0A1UE88_ENTIV|nr:hypothetical protein EIN_246970 [Entamoeba invadens IP1]ELP94803.1 hypothetical protein EIN_246970 [Entamoeba invadens IP1]|eukprot:XP_004261574.1 hypothetical protein EIN_246970 [Entamoeba invadens IP1]
MFTIILSIILLSRSESILYQDGDFGWTLNDSAFIGYGKHEVEGKTWLGGNMQISDMLKFNGEEQTINDKGLCFTSQWTSNDDSVRMKVRILPDEFRGDDDPKTGLIVRVFNKKEYCVSLEEPEFDVRIVTQVKYVSIQLYQTLENTKSFVYFNNIKFQSKYPQNNNQVSDQSIDWSANNGNDGVSSLMIAAALVLILFLF